MKRISLFLVFACFMVRGFAQPDLRQAAEEYLNAGKLDKALENINLCVSDQSLSADASTWVIRGNVYTGILSSQDETYKSLDPDPAQKALDSYKKATVLDTKQQYKDIIFNGVNWLRNNYYNHAVDKYNNRQYREAMQQFANGADALGSINIADTVSLYYAAACAGLAGVREKAKQYYTELLKQNARSTDIYVVLADSYRQDNDFENALRVVREGQGVHPGNLNLFLSEINIYLTSGDRVKALLYLKSAISKDPSNPTIFFALGTLYDGTFNDNMKADQERQEAFGMAIEAYKSAIRLNPEYFDAIYNLGALYVNQAANILDKANKQPPSAQQEYERLKAEADKYLDAAIPYLEKASEIKPDDINVLSSLKQIYTRRNMPDKLKAVSDRLEALQGK